MDRDNSALPNQQVALGISGIYKDYGNGVQALRGIDLDISEGEFVTLLGPSGSGKSTLLMIIAGFTQQTAGHITTLGRDITSVAPERRNFGVVFQNYALFPHMNAYRNVAYPLVARGIRGTEQRRKVSEALAMVDLQGYERRLPAELSGGQQQRVALARALVYRPAVLLLDEPLAALDRSLRERMQLELRSLNRRLGITFLYVTHDQDEALTMSDRIVVLSGGAVEQVGTPQEVYERPTTSFVARFIGRANLFVGDVLTSDENFVRVALASGSVANLRHNGRQWGAKAVAVVHPEKVTISAASGARAPDEAVFDGRLEEEIFAGRVWRYIVTAGGTQIEAQMLKRIDAGQGRMVQVSWRWSDAWVVPEENENEVGFVGSVRGPDEAAATNHISRERFG